MFNKDHVDKIVPSRRGNNKRSKLQQYEWLRLNSNPLYLFRSNALKNAPSANKKSEQKNETKLLSKRLLNIHRSLMPAPHLANIKHQHEHS